MTRKRFIKLVMACGVQKRGAQKLALIYHAENLSYEDAFYHFYAGKLKQAALELGVPFQEATEAIQKLAKALCELGAELLEALTEFFDGREEYGKAD